METTQSHKVQLKICGMKHNAAEVVVLVPHYLGFIFWEPSSRYFDGNMPPISPSIKKTGVFVDAPLEEVVHKTKQYGLVALQLHGKESPAYCQELREVLQQQKLKIEIIKVFSIKDQFDFGTLKPYETVCDFYLFDTKGELPGGNGYGFDWKVLEGYPSQKPYFLSGGIGPEDVSSILAFLNTPAAQYCYALDVNSKFESAPGNKKIQELKEFKHALSSIIS